MIDLLSRHRPEDRVAVGGEGVAGGLRRAADLWADFQRIAALLPPAEADKEVLVIAADRYHFAVALLAAWSRGHCVALPPNAQPERLRELNERPEIVAMLHDADESIGIDIRPHLQDALVIESEDFASLVAPADAKKVVSVWTSGSSGEHQRHTKTASQLWGEAALLARHFEVDGDEVVVATVPPYHIYGLLFSILVPLMGGAAFLRQQPLHAGVVAKAVQDFGATILVSVPAHLRVLRLLEKTQIPSIGRVFSSGAPLPEETAKMIRERFELGVSEVLGSTETGGIAWRLNKGDDPPWEPLPGVEISVDEEGRLAVDSSFLPPECQRPFLTEDRVERASGGSFRHLGRMDGVVKVGGKRIALTEIEARMLAVEGVEDAVVGAVEDTGARGKEIVALAVAPSLSPEAIKAELRRWLDPVVLPRRLRLLDRLPREENGKIRRENLLRALEVKKAPRELEWSRAEESGDVSASDPDGALELRGRVPRDLLALRGHFRGNAVVPGVVLTQFAEARAREHWPELAEIRGVLRLKFTRSLVPGEAFSVRLEPSPRGGQARVNFRFFGGDSEYASGCLLFGGGEVKGVS